MRRVCGGVTWKLNADGAWEGRIDGRLVAGIVKQVWKNTCWRLIRYDGARPYEWRFIGFFSSLKIAQEHGV